VENFFLNPQLCIQSWVTWAKQRPFYRWIVIRLSPFVQNLTALVALSCGANCVILRLAILIQYQSVTDRHTDTHDDGIYRASIASCSKNRERPRKSNMVISKLEFLGHLTTKWGAISTRTPKGTSFRSKSQAEQLRSPVLTAIGSVNWKPWESFITTRRYAKHGICRCHVSVSVCLSVCVCLSHLVLYHKKLCYCRGTVRRVCQ